MVECVVNRGADVSPSLFIKIYLKTERYILKIYLSVY